MNIILFLFVFVCVIGAMYNFYCWLTMPARKTEFNADFMNPHEVLSRCNKGFIVDGRLAMDRESALRGMIVYGPTGSQKSVSVLIPNILHLCKHNSLIINDPSGELYFYTSGYVNQFATVKVINYTRPEISQGYNPLHRVKNISDVKKVCSMLVHNALGRNPKDPFWNISATNLLSTLAILLVFYLPKEYRNLYNLNFLLNTFSYSPKKLDIYFVRSHDVALLSEYKALLSFDSKTMNSVIQTARSSLSLFTDPQLAACTSFDSLSLAEMRGPEHPVCVYINNSIQDQKYYSLITSMLFEQLWGEIMSKLPDKNSLPIYFLLEEASSLYLPSLNIACCNLRKFLSSTLQIYQSPFNLYSLYSQAESKAIESNAFAQLYLPGQPIQVASELSQDVLGKFEYLDDNEVKHIRPLMTPDEVRESDMSILCCGNLRPMRLSMHPFFKQSRLKHMTEIPPFTSTSCLPFDTPPILQLNEA